MGLRQFVKDERRTLLLIVLLAIIVRVVLLGAMLKHGFDDQEEGVIARSLLNGQGYSFAGSPTAHKPPIYTLILAACFLPFPSEWRPINYDSAVQYQAHLLDQILKIMVASLTVPVLYRLGKKVYNRTTGLLGAFLFAINPLLAVQVLFPGHMPYDMLFFTFLLLLLVKMIREPDSRTILAYSLVCAVAVLENPIILGFILPGQFWLFFWEQRYPSRKQRWQTLFLPIVFMLVSITPWIYRNFRVFHQIVPLTSNFPLELWYGNNELSTGGFYHGPAPDNSLPGLAALNEVQRNQALGAQAVKFILDHPATALKLRISSALFFWFGTWQFSGFPIIFTWAWFFLNILTVTAGMAGLVLATIRAWKINAPFLLMILANFAPYVLTHSGDDRYRAGIMPLMMLSIAFLLVRPNVQAEPGRQELV
jgi:hypothetical protein